MTTSGMTPAELAAYRALVPFGMTAADRAEFAARVVAALAEVQPEYLHLGENDEHGSWGVTAELATQLPWTVPVLRRRQVAGAAVMAAVRVLRSEGNA